MLLRVLIALRFLAELLLVLPPSVDRSGFLPQTGSCYRRVSARRRSVDKNVTAVIVFINNDDDNDDTAAAAATVPSVHLSVSTIELATDTAVSNRLSTAHTLIGSEGTVTHRIIRIRAHMYPNTHALAGRSGSFTFYSGRTIFKQPFYRYLSSSLRVYDATFSAAIASTVVVHTYQIVLIATATAEAKESAGRIPSTDSCKVIHCVYMLVSIQFHL